MQQPHREGNNPAEVDLTILEHVLKRPRRHLRPNLLPLRDEGDAQQRDRLVTVVLLEMLRAHPKKLLHLHHVARPRVCTRLHSEAAVLPNLPRHRLEGLHCHISRLLQPQEQQPKPQAGEPCHRVLHNLFFPLQHALHNRLRNIRLARPHVHQPQRQSRQGEELDGRRGVRDDRGEDVENLLLLRSRVRQAQPESRPNTLDRRALRVHLVRHQRQGGVALGAHVGRDDADGEGGARADVIAV
mmetsp:Transcript_6584/g.15194  ORF Transcript_6584/g.15194 Transcript_6584/m.15194 type:complete len:242 (+) Transcript_6584:853-1578(+)